MTRVNWLIDTSVNIFSFLRITYHDNYSLKIASTFPEDSKHSKQEFKI